MHTEMEEYYATNKFWPYQHKVLKMLLPCFLTIVHYSVIATEVTCHTIVKIVMQMHW
ncbi:hypothetical protein ACS0PU_001758 [Formica fusca]